jgi:hypothetical protein
MEVFAIFAVFIVIAIVFRLMAGGMDSDRVGEYIRAQGGELIDSQWSPFGRGWFGEKNDRIYEVRYRDRLGNVHEATVKTSMLSGVYFTEDRIVQAAKSDESQSRDIQLENARLRQRIAELESRDQT